MFRRHLPSFLILILLLACGTGSRAGGLSDGPAGAAMKKLPKQAQPNKASADGLPIHGGLPKQASADGLHIHGGPEGGPLAAALLRKQARRKQQGVSPGGRGSGVEVAGAPACAATIAACVPKPRRPEEMAAWMDYHAEFVAEADTRREAVDVLFLGDSITEALRRNARFQQKPGVPEAWEKESYFKNAAVFAISGDETGHLLWRLLHGELDRLQPLVVVIAIGTNNLPLKSPADTFAAVQAIVATIRRKLPLARIIVNELFPRGRPTATEPQGLKPQVDAFNGLVSSTYGGGRGPAGVTAVACGGGFVTGTGIVNPELMPDYLHPNAAGHGLWAACLRGPIEAALQECAGPVGSTPCRRAAVSTALAGLAPLPKLESTKAGTGGAGGAAATPI